MIETRLAPFLHAAALICACLGLAACTMDSSPTAGTTTVTQPPQSVQAPPPIVNTTDRFWPASRIDETLPRLP